MSHTSFESFFASQGPKYASKEPILSARNGKKKRNEAWNWMKSKDCEIFHHHLFFAITQLTIVNFFKRRVGKTFSPFYLASLKARSRVSEVGRSARLCMSSIMKPTSNTDFSRKVTVEHFYHWGSASVARKTTRWPHRAHVQATSPGH